MNNHRDGSNRHTITKGSINYWPNRDGVNRPVPPSNNGKGGYEE